jgi:UDP-2,3-diacylglucosamine pyrophosphatase LpxH
MLHPNLSTWIAESGSRASRDRQDHAHPVDELRDIAAARLASDRSLQLVVFGHSHVASLQRLGGGVYANAGTWQSSPSFLRVTPEEIELLRWTGSAEGDRLHAVDRRAQEALP